MVDTGHISPRRICIIGCGKMGGACLSGWLSSNEGMAKDLVPESFTCVVSSKDSKSRIELDHGVDCTTSLDQAASKGPYDMVLLAVKPQVFPQVLENLATCEIMEAAHAENSECSQGDVQLPLVLSIAAGISTSKIESALPEGVHVVRAMPNMPLQVCHGATAICAGANAASSDIELANSLFSALGESWVVDEGMIDAVCAISGGGPAYFAYTVEALRRAGEKLGLDAHLAEALALETMGGTYEAMVETGIAPEDMRASVCSPGGTTLAALSVLDASDFLDMYAKAMNSAVRRAHELRESE